VDLAGVRFLRDQLTYATDKRKSYGLSTRLKNFRIFDNPYDVLAAYDLFRKTFVRTLNLLCLNCLQRLC